MIEEEYNQLLIEEFSGVAGESDSLDRAKHTGAPLSRNARRGTKQSKTVNQSSRDTGPVANM
jgi:hypothetical protein